MAHLEIERKFLLNGVPRIPAGAQVLRIEQGYLNAFSSGASAESEGFATGRLRRTIFPDGSVQHTHTIKTGSGVSRQEIERHITPKQFERHWPCTEGRRLRKIRHRVRENDLTWEIDVIERPDLVLAEVELRSPETKIVIPQWLGPHVVREVTDEPEYTNAAIAARIGSVSSDQ